jgi:hypothetical protein
MDESNAPGALGDSGDTRLYVYAIGAADIVAPTQAACFGGPLFVVRRHRLGAVVSRVRPSARPDHRRASETSETADEAPDGAAPSASGENLLRHEATVEAICAGAAALPVRFGVILPDAAAVERALERQSDILRADLLRIGDKVEMGVIALWNPAGTQAGAEKGAEEATAADQRAELRPGLAYLRARQAQYQRSATLRARAERLGDALDAELRPRPLQTQRALCPSPRLALRAVHLLERAQVGAFGEAFDAARRRHAVEARLLLSGPWPPYSFVTAPRPITSAHASAHVQ